MTALEEQTTLEVFLRKARPPPPTPDAAGPLTWPGIRTGTIEARPYQVNLARAALAGRTLVVLPTGLGKTIVAALVAGHVLTAGSGKVLMAAPTRPLVEQHLTSFQRFLQEESQAMLTGMVAANARKKAYATARVIHATPQVLGNDLKRRRLPLHEADLLIIDEAHRAVGDYAYVDLAKALRPDALLLGLTASPGGDPQRINEVTANLGITRVEARSPTDADVAPYVHEILVQWVKVALPPEVLRIRALLDRVVKERAEPLRRTALLPPKPFVSRGDLIQAGNKIRARMGRSRAPSLFGLLLNQAIALQALHAVELLETQGIAPFLDYLGRDHAKTKSWSVFRKDARVAEAMVLAGAMGGPSHPKLAALVEILTRAFAANPDTLAMVFAQYRDTIRTIQAALDAAGIPSLRFVGQADRESDAGLSQKEQRAVLDRFRAGERRVLVASSVGEEGLDVPATDLVVFYEPVPSEIRSIQRRGRTGRGRVGNVVVLVAEGTRDEAFLWSGMQKEKRMKKIVKGMKRHDAEP